MSDNDLIRRGEAIAAINKSWTDDELILAIRALPAAQVTVKPGEIERAVWSAMIWAADNNPGFNGVPEYTSGGNSFAETECRSAAAHIRSTLTVTPHDPAKVAALVATAEAVLALDKEIGTRSTVHDMLEAALAAWKDGGEV